MSQKYAFDWKSEVMDKQLAQWERYQEEAAAFFRSLGLKAEVNAKKLRGARATHDVDVWVYGSIYGLEFRWVIECKAWKSNVPKEKVMALIAICQDLGADKGFLLSEKGFQSGAIRGAENTNVVLTSLADLNEITQQFVEAEALSRLQLDIIHVKDRLHDIARTYEDYYFGPAIRHMGYLNFFEIAMKDARNGVFPTVYIAGEHFEERIPVSNITELLTAGRKMVNAAEDFIRQN